jgi:hypothetical protein|tara:strand:+ start:288 stop:758 length:471 start_codon:yes stop_codon:yes gene_type:complete
MDPFTAMAAATAAFKGIKKAVEVGKEISSIGSTLSTWSKAVSDMDFLDEKAKKPPMYKMFSDNQANALEIWTQKQKLKEMREDLRSHISWTYGPSAWDEIVRIEAKQRKEQRELVYKKKELIDNVINGVCIGLVALAGIGASIALLYIIGAKQGKW